MAELPPLEASDFKAFFEAIHGYPPFPWQAALAARLGGGDGWPGVLDLPTGSGKTAAIDVAVFQLALEAGRVERRAPLRVVYVVDRRTIVDQAYERAEDIAAKLDGADGRVLGAVRARLASFSRGGRPLAVTALRGGIARSDDWARSPDQPLVAISTVDQVGSRLLFRGYGVSDRMKPVHAGLLGNDALYLLDEVHLSEPFRQTLEAIRRRYGGWAEVPLPSRFTVVEMSATPGETDEVPFGLTDGDRGNEVLARRLEARKPATLRLATGRAFAGEVEKAVTPLAREAGATVAVVVNRVAMARDIHERLVKSLGEAEVHLLTGRMRPLDRRALEEKLFPRLRSGRVRDPTAKSVVVVATQCIEAGADFDFDALVTECASLDALRQRFGRLDRMGELGSAPGVVVARTDTLKDDPVYGAALNATWEWLNAAAEGSDDGTVDFGIEALEVPDDVSALVAPRAVAPIMLPAHLDAWVQTAPTPTPDPDISLWLHGPQRGAADVQVVWRADLSAELLELAGGDDAKAAGPAKDLALAAVEALPPASGEAMAVPFAAVRRWLQGRAEPEIFDVEGARDEEDDSWRDNVSDRERAPRRALAWWGDDSRVVDGRGLRPGMTIVVPASYGGVAHDNWAPASETVVEDLGEQAVFEQRGRAVLRLHPAVVARWFGEDMAAPTPAQKDLDPDGPDDRERVCEWLKTVAAPAQLRAQVAHLKREEKRVRVERIEGFDPTAEHVADDGLRTSTYLLVSARRRASSVGAGLEVTSEDDRASFTGREVTLAEHLGGVRDFARNFAARAGLPEEVVADVALAGWWHDVGKADPRFQRLLHGGSEFKALVAPEPLAKSRMPMNDRRARRRAQLRSRYPQGARHEVMSVALMEAAAGELEARANDWDLVLHLVASHHGWCRPLAPWVPDREPLEVTWAHDGVALGGSSDHGLARLDSGIGERFWRVVRRYGWWGLAWLEAALRLGDHRRSEAEQRGGTS